MNKYYVIEITIYNDGTNPAYGIYAKDTENDAIKLFHQKMAAGIGAANVAHELVHVINTYGVVIMNESYDELEA